MSNESEIRIVLGSERSAGSVDRDVWIQPPLIGDRRELIEGDRSILVNQQNIFEQEYNKLNTSQKQAVDTIYGPVMVVAGPGTGKTQII